ncbi:MAG: hypothetical protein JO356_06705 [Acidobacteria bacterium]|nr:hypothetical protein [Acidobacteriota bacterium]
MSRVSVFLNAALLVAVLGMACPGQGLRNAPIGTWQVSQVSSAAASAAKDQLSSGKLAQDRAQSSTAADRSKRIEGSEGASEAQVNNGAPLPQTSTILPLLGFIGLGSLVAGLFARR